MIFIKPEVIINKSEVHKKVRKHTQYIKKLLENKKIKLTD